MSVAFNLAVMTEGKGKPPETECAGVKVQKMRPRPQISSLF